MLPPSKFGQCLEIDDRRSKLKFCDVTWPSLYFKDSSVFYRLVFFRLFCKIIDLLDTNLNFLGSIFDVNIDNCANCCEVNVPRSYIFRNELFKLFSLFRPIIYRPDELFNFEPYNILTKIDDVIKFCKFKLQKWSSLLKPRSCEKIYRLSCKYTKLWNF